MEPRYVEGETARTRVQGFGANPLEGLKCFLRRRPPTLRAAVIALVLALPISARAADPGQPPLAVTTAEELAAPLAELPGSPPHSKSARLPFTVRYSLREGFTLLPAGPTQQPSMANINSVSLRIYDPVNNSLRIEASPGLRGTHTPNDANQVFGSIFDAANNAIHVNCISGCGGGGTQMFGTDVTAINSTNQKVVGFNSIPLASSAPSNGQVYQYSATFNQWMPQTISSGAGGASFQLQANNAGALAGVAGTSVNFTSGAVSLTPASGQDATPLTLAPSVTSPTADIFDVCAALPCTTANKYFWLTSNGNMSFSGNNATYGANGQSTNSFLKLIGSTVPSAPYVEGTKQDGTNPVYSYFDSARTGVFIDAAAGDNTPEVTANVTAPELGNNFLNFANGTAANKPAACTIGDVYFATDATAGKNLFYCTATNTWTQQAGGGSSTVFQTNGSGLSSSTTVNFQNSAATDGLTLSVSNPSAGNVQLGLSGSLTVPGGGTGVTTITGPIKGNGASAFSAAAAADIVGLFSTCSGTQYLGADGACHTASGGTRTWRFDYQGVCQAGVASAPVNFPISNAPSYVACSSTTITPEFQIPASNTSDTFWVKLRVPAGHTGVYTLTTTFRSAATSNSATVQPTYACVAAGQVPDNPTFSNAGSTFTLTPAATTLQQVTATDTFTPTCADNADLYVQYTFTANTVTSPINFSYIGLAVQGNL